MKKMFAKMSRVKLYILSRSLYAICGLASVVVVRYALVNLLSSSADKMTQTAVQFAFIPIVLLIMQIPRQFRRKVLAPRLICPHCGNKIIRSNGAIYAPVTSYYTWLKETHCLYCGKELDSEGGEDNEKDTD